MTNKIISVGLVILLTVLLIAGCGGNKFKNAKVEDIPEIVDVLFESAVEGHSMVYIASHGFITDAENAQLAMFDLMTGGPDALNYLLDLLNDEDPDEAFKAARVLRLLLTDVELREEEFDRIMDVVFEKIENEPDLELRRESTLILVSLVYGLYFNYNRSPDVFDDQKDKIFQGIELGLGDPDETVREAAAEALGTLQWRTNYAITGTQGLDGTSPFDDFAHEIATLSAQLLGDQNPVVAAKAASVLFQLEVKFDDTIPALVDALESEDAWTRLNAAGTLAQMGVEAELVVPVLIELLSETGDERYRTISEEASMALGLYGPGAIDAIPTLLETMKDDDRQVRRAGSDAVAAIGEPIDEILSTLFEYLDDENPIVRGEGAWCLGKLGVGAESALDKLQELTEDEVRDVRGEARMAIQRIEAALNPAEDELQ